MTGLVIRLLGRPEIELGGAVVTPPRGHKPWAVLAYLLLTERPVPRARLAEMLFGDARDPLGALRWTLAQLRRTLDGPEMLKGDPLTIELPDEATVDAVSLNAGVGDATLARGDLLEGVHPKAGTEFEAWLTVERRRLAGVCEGVLRDAALENLAAGDPLDGAALATRALAFSPFDESLHELLVRCLARAGQIGAARHHAHQCEMLFRRELGRAVDPRVVRAADLSGIEPSTPAGDRAAAVGQLSAGRAAVDAGAVEPGVSFLRQACAEARAVGDPDLLAQSLAALGEALVHSVRGTDEEGAAMLHEAMVLADDVENAELAARICRELGFVELQAGRGTSAARWLERAGRLATGDDERAAVLGVRGMALSDRAHYAAAIALLGRSIAIADDCGNARQAAWSLAILGRAHLLRDELSSARQVVDRSLALVETEGWVAFQPFPETVRAEVALREGDQEHAGALFDHAFSLGCRLGDPCWEALAARGIGLLHEARGNHAAALGALRDAVDRAVRVADPYVWVQAYCLDALVAVATAGDDGAMGAEVAELERLSARGDMRELVVRAALHRADLGDRAGVASARVLAEAIDNPALHSWLAD